LSFFGAVLVCAAIALPAQAAKPKHPACATPQHLSYEVWGKLARAGDLIWNSNEGGYQGTLTVLASRTNNHAKIDRHKMRTYSVDRHTLMTFGHGVSKTAPAKNSAVHLKGTITSMPKACTGFVSGITILKAVLQAAKR